MRHLTAEKRYHSHSLMKRSMRLTRRDFISIRGSHPEKSRLQSNVTTSRYFPRYDSALGLSRSSCECSEADSVFLVFSHSFRYSESFIHLYFSIFFSSLYVALLCSRIQRMSYSLIGLFLSVEILSRTKRWTNIDRLSRSGNENFKSHSSDPHT